MASSEHAAVSRDLVLDAERLQSVIDAWDEGMQILSPEWRYLYVNAAAARHGRKTREELYGRTLLECYPGIEATPLYGVMKRCMHDHSSALMLNEFLYPDGGTGWFELRIKPCAEGVIVLSLPRAAGELRLP